MKAHALLSLPVLLAGAAAVAHTPPAPEFVNETLRPVSTSPGSERVVKGAPYCAEAVHEQVQWLADPNGGPPNRIVQKQTTRLCRDGEGRTRQEVERGNRKLVYLRDPVARESWVLDPERKTARAGGMSSFFDDSAMRDYSERMRDYSERMRDWARGVAERLGTQPRAGGATPPTPPTPPTAATPPTPPAPPAPAVITFGPGEREVDVRVMRLEVPGDFPMPPLGWTRGLSARGPGSTTPLGSKEIDGLRVNGERTSWTIEAGKLGNDKPIVMFREVWSSPDLMLTVSSRDFDPRTGEVLYRLQNVKRGEPDAVLMRVPGDYTTSRRGERQPGRN